MELGWALFSYCLSATSTVVMAAVSVFDSKKECRLLAGFAVGLLLWGFCFGFQKVIDDYQSATENARKLTSIDDGVEKLNSNHEEVVGVYKKYIEKLEAENEALRIKVNGPHAGYRIPPKYLEEIERLESERETIITEIRNPMPTSE